MIKSIDTLKEIWKKYEKKPGEEDRKDPHIEKWEEWKKAIEGFSRDGDSKKAIEDFSGDGDSKKAILDPSGDNASKKIDINNYQLNKVYMPKKIKKWESKEKKNKYEEAYKSFYDENLKKCNDDFYNSFGYFLLLGSSGYFGAGQNKVLGLLKNREVIFINESCEFELNEVYQKRERGFNYDDIKDEDAIDELDKDIKAIKEIIDIKDVNKLAEIEKNKGRFLNYPRHKLMVLASLSEDALADLKFKLPFKAEIGKQMFEDFCDLAEKEGDDYKNILIDLVSEKSGESIKFEDARKKGANNWVIKGAFVINFLYKCLELDRSVSYDTTSRLSEMLWKLDKAKEFEDIDKYWQIVYTGAPGTGKTYGIKDYVKINCLENPLEDDVIKKILEDKMLREKGNETVTDEMINDWKKKQQKFVQFHSSYDYSDFVEGIRPIQLENKKEPTFVRMDGVFKEFCRNVVEYNKKYKEVHNNKEVSSVIEDYKNGKTNEGCPVPHFYFIIDEINRADIGKVFGELMFGLEETYRGEENAFDTQYMNMPTYVIRNKKAHELSDDEDVFKKGFYVPENVHIIGSMNNIDRSVETFDFALRRRFQWKDIKANNMLEPVLSAVLRDKPEAMENLNDIITKIKNMNNVIDKGVGSECGLDENYHIGPAYFRNYDGSEVSLSIIWDEKIEPILREYVRGRAKEKVDEFIRACKEALGVNESEKTGDETEDHEDNEVAVNGE